MLLISKTETSEVVFNLFFFNQTPDCHTLSTILLAISRADYYLYTVTNFLHSLSLTHIGE